VPAKKVVIKNNKGTETLALINRSNIQELDIENGVVLQSEVNTAEDAHNAPNLKRLPAISSTQGTSLRVYGVPALTDTVIDDSSNASRSLFRFYGTSTSPTRGLKGLTVSNTAPFDGASPQIDISYTGMDRVALVNLFNSLPTVTDSQVCTITGATGADDLTAEDLAIATGKGWTVTR